MRHPLSDTYRSEREQLLALGDSLSEEQGRVMTTACPAWSIKDVYAHLAGISSSILSGDIEGAATAEWADGHVRDRRDRSLADVLSEWRADGVGVSEAMEAAGAAFPFQLFVDQWTHGWDLRAARGQEFAATPDLSVYEYYLDDFVKVIEANTSQAADPVANVTLKLPGRQVALGAGEAIGSIELDLFEFARITMGRRSAAQLRKLQWPEAVADPEPYIDLLVFWSVNEVDVIDPVLVG